jgi:anti-sigma factor RsiW
MKIAQLNLAVSRSKEQCRRNLHSDTAFSFTSLASLSRLTRTIAAPALARGIVPGDMLTRSKHPARELTKESQRSPGSLSPAGL